MKIQVNGDEQEIAGEQINVLEVIEKNNVKMPEMVSVQLNGNFIDRHMFKKTHIADGDELEFLYFMGGGSL